MLLEIEIDKGYEIYIHFGKKLKYSYKSNEHEIDVYFGLLDELYTGSRYRSMISLFSNRYYYVFDINIFPKGFDFYIYYNFK